MTKTKVYTIIFTVMCTYITQCGWLLTEDDRDIGEYYHPWDPSNPRIDPKINKEYKHETILKRQLRSYQISCSDEFDCPEYTASIVSIIEDKTYFCSGSFIAEDMILTNHHCVKEMIDSGLNCSEHMIISNKDNKQTFCKNIITQFEQDFTKNSSDNNDLSFQRDVAIIALTDQINVDTINIKNQKTFNDSEKLSIVAINPPADKSLLRTMQVKECTSVKSSVVDPGFNSDFSFYLPLFHCTNDPRAGNSGSIVIDQLNQGVGVYWGGYSFKEESSRIKNAENISTLFFNVDTSSFPFFQKSAVNLNCIDIDTNSGLMQWNKTLGCNDYQESYIEKTQNNLNTLKEQTILKMENLIIDSQSRGDIPSYLKFKLDKDSLKDQEYILKPDCFYSDKIIDIIANPEPFATSTFEAEFKVELNENYVLQVDLVDVNKEQPTEVRFTNNIDDILQNNLGENNQYKFISNPKQLQECER